LYVIMKPRKRGG